MIRPASARRPGELPVPVRLLAPPYAAITDLPAGEARLCRGSIVVLESRRPAEECLLLPSVLPLVRGRYPTAPVVLWIREHCRETAQLAHLAARLHVRGVIVEGQPLLCTLRPILTSREHLAGDVVEWLMLRGLSFSPRVRYVVRRIFRVAPRHAEISTLLEELREPPASTRARFRKRRLPPPRQWLRAARALHLGLHLQAESDKPLLRLAIELGYSDHSSLSQQLHRAFGLRPGAIRGTLGWEWMLERWVDSAVRLAAA